MARTPRRWQNAEPMKHLVLCVVAAVAALASCKQRPPPAPVFASQAHAAPAPADAGPTTIDLTSSLPLRVGVRSAAGDERWIGTTGSGPPVRIVLPPGATWFVQPREPVRTTQA